MKRQISIILCLLLLMASTTINAQTQADANISEGGYGMVRTNISTNYSHGWGNVGDCFATRVSYEFLRKKYFTFTANFRYTSTEVDFDASETSNGFDPDLININGNHMMGQAGITATYRGSLLGKPVVGIAMANSEWSKGGFERVSGIAMGLIMLRANRDTQFGLGPLVMINSCSRIPAFLVFMYRHRFNDKWLLNLYGTMMGMDYTPTRNDLISIGADVDVKAFYFKPGDDRLPDRCRFTSTSCRPMIKYRRRLAPNLYLDVESGVSLKMSSRVNGVSGTKRYLDFHQKAAAFVQTSVSYAL